MYSGIRYFNSEEAEIREYGEEYRQYKRRFEKAMERWEHPFYDKLWGLRLPHGFSPNYEFTEPFEISPSLKGKLELEENRKYTFWEKMASEPEKQKKILEDKISYEKYSLKKRCMDATTLLLICHHVLLKEIINLKTVASDHLNIAEMEYSNNTFSMFWDAIEIAAQDLDELAFLVWAVSVKIKRDYDWLNSELTNFPPFFFLEAMPDVSDLISKYDKLVRRGFSNYQFASIWEARRTRESIIAGFGSLEKAIHGVGNSLRNEFANLNRQLESNAGNQILAAQIQTLVLQYGLKEKK
jgi:hypothetical protein